MTDSGQNPNPIHHIEAQDRNGGNGEGEGEGKERIPLQEESWVSDPTWSTGDLSINTNWVEGVAATEEDTAAINMYTICENGVMIPRQPPVRKEKNWADDGIGGNIGVVKPRHTATHLGQNGGITIGKPTCQSQPTYVYSESEPGRSR